MFAIILYACKDQSVSAAILAAVAGLLEEDLLHCKLK